MLHKNAPLGDVHIVHNWAVADAVARAALSVVTADIGKVCWQQNNDSFWFLKNTTPTWVSMGTGASLAIGDVTGLQTALDSKAATTHNHDSAYLGVALKGAASGLAELDGTGKVPAAQLPSYVDDVLEYANLAAFPGTGESGKIYVALDSNLTYRWTGSIYVAVGDGGGGAAVTIKDEGVTLTASLASIDFTGAGVSATNVGGAVTVNIAGGGGGGTAASTFASRFIFMGA